MNERQLIIDLLVKIIDNNDFYLRLKRLDYYDKTKLANKYFDECISQCDIDLSPYKFLDLCTKYYKSNAKSKSVDEAINYVFKNWRF